MTLSPTDLKDYVGERAQRGAMLPRGWRKVDRIELQ
jgi:topoisomerase IV subunit A